MGRGPARFQFGQPLRGQYGAFAGIHGRPLVKADQRMRLLVECEEGNLIGGRRFSQHCLRFGQREGPKVLTPHAGAGIHQQDDLVADAGFLIGNHGLLKKRPGKTQRQETEHQATQQQQENIFQPITARHSRRSRLEKHQRAEGHPLLAGAANEVKDDGQRDGNGAEQKEWREEVHAEDRRFRPEDGTI